MGGHRPGPTPPPQAYRTVSLMQGFGTSAPKQAAGDQSTIDFFFFPEIPESPSTNQSQIRVPLLPDNYNPDRSANSSNVLETLDDAVPGPEISIIAHHPDFVVPATITEVVGNEGTDVELPASSSTPEDVKDPGIFKQIWTGFLEDIFGPKVSKPTV